MAMFKDNKLRLLMTLAGFERLGIDDDMESTWIVPSSAASGSLSDALDAIASAERDPPAFEDGKDAEDMIRRKHAARPQRAAFDDDSDGDGIINDEEEDFLFPAGGPTIKRADALQQLKKKRRTRHEEDGKEPLDEAAREARADARRLADLERRRKVKSELFVHDSDDEDDEERDRLFFEDEERLRERQSNVLLTALREKGNGVKDKERSGNGEKRKTADGSDEARMRRKRIMRALDSDENESDDEDMAGSSSPHHSEQAKTSADEDTDTPLSSPHATSSQDLVAMPRTANKSPVTSPAAKELRRDVDMLDIGADGDSQGGEDEDEGVVAKPGRRRVRAGFVIESDSE